MSRLIAATLALQLTLSVRTLLVALPVTVTDGHGGRVTGLTSADFRVYDDGRLQPVTLFQHGPSPITLGLVVDHSTSMRDNLPAVTAALATFGEVTDPDDELFVVDFNEHVSRPLGASGAPFTSDARAIAAAVAAIPPRGQTALYDAIAAGLTQLAGGRWDKRTLIVVSDGGDNASRRTYRDIEALARQSGVVIYAIGLRGTSEEQAPRVLAHLASDTGGVAYFPHDPAAVSMTLSEIVRDLREQYTIGFSPETPAPRFHRLVVTAATRDGRRLRVRTRAGYLMAEGQ